MYLRELVQMGVEWIYLAQGRDQLLYLENKVMNLQVP
jgi:hypothetical protein